MDNVGSFDGISGVAYSPEESKKQDKDMWVTDLEFTFYIGVPEDQKYVTVPKGFITDGASVPRLFWALIPPWGVYGQAAVVHDWLCVHKKLTKNGEDGDLNLTLKQIDDILYIAMKASGTNWIKRNVIYSAVRIWHLLNL